MKNDPIIHAPISKIVEAIMKALDNRIGSYIYPFQIEEALSSLESSEREVMIEYEMTANRNIPKLEWDYYPNILRQVTEKVDRYLAEKGGDNVTR